MEARVSARCDLRRKGRGLRHRLGRTRRRHRQGRNRVAQPPEAAGEIEEPGNWLRWTKSDGILEVKASSWNFQTVVRYRIEEGKPALVAYQDVDVARAFTYGMGVAIIMMIGIYLRKLRN